MSESQSCVAFQAARKVLDTCYTFLPTLGSNAQVHKPILALCYADMEMERASSDSKDRALHVLFHLALDGTYKPMKKGAIAPRSQEEMVAAKRHFQMMITEAVTLNDGVLDPCHLAWVIAGALFEEMLSPDEESGALMAVNILRNVIESTDESVRATSSCHELLQTRYFIIDSLLLCTAVWWIRFGVMFNPLHSTTSARSSIYANS